MRMASDIVRADSIIDLRELTFLDDIRKKYNITEAEEKLAYMCTLAQAIGTLQKSDARVKNDFLKEMTKAIMSDSICTRQEAVLMLMLNYCFKENTEQKATVYSIDSAEDINFEEAQILYIESEYDNHTNKELQQHYREIVNELRLIGYNFVYLPKVAEHYASLSEKDLNSLVRFLYPAMTDLQKSQINKQVTTLTTADFCHEQIQRRPGMEELEKAVPSLMLKIGDSAVNNKTIANFLVVSIEDDALQMVQRLCNQFVEMYQPRVLNPICEERNRFAYAGLYKQVFDTFMFRKGIRSSVAVDLHGGRIMLPEAGVELEGLARREKALYALILLESKNGGINFSKPENAAGLKRFNRRMESIQNKYNEIYSHMGGEKEKAPRLDVATTRAPMLAKIKSKINALGELLDRSDDYMAQRNILGNYCVKLSPELCKFYDNNSKTCLDFSESDFWNNLRAM